MRRPCGKSVALALVVADFLEPSPDDPANVCPRPDLRVVTVALSGTVPRSRPRSAAECPPCSNFTEPFVPYALSWACSATSGPFAWLRRRDGHEHPDGWPHLRDTFASQLQIAGVQGKGQAARHRRLPTAVPAGADPSPSRPGIRLHLLGARRSRRPDDRASPCECCARGAGESNVLVGEAGPRKTGILDENFRTPEAAGVAARKRPH
jgi:hypothetical protein